MKRLASIISATLIAGGLAVDARATTVPAAPVAPPAAVSVRGGTEQVEVLGAAPGAEVSLRAPDGSEQSVTADANGAALFRRLTPGPGFVVTAGPGGGPPSTVTVLAETDHPAQSFYDAQSIGEGFGYITTRDGTTLSANVVLPGPLDEGPYPTVIEYNGYSPSDPDNAAFGRIYTAQGFAYVGVNMRGSGCSGGTYGVFDTNNALDGYDVVEAVSAQPWVAGHGVGLVGISYGGISQLFVAARRPPHLKAITPLSVYDDAFRSLSYPGGMLNTGFTVNWMQTRYEEAMPFGQAWTRTRAAAGDAVCAANQQARLQQQDIVALNAADPFFPGAGGTGVDLVTADLVGAITVPVFLAGAWQDEQTGGHFATMLDRFTGAPHVFIDLTNGGHTDSLNPTSLARYAEFLNLYVADRVPSLEGLKLVAPILAKTLFGVGDTPAFIDRFAGKTLEQARAEFEAEPSVRVLVESGGAAGATPGAAVPNGIVALASWPAPGAVITRWFLDQGGRLEEAGGEPSGTSSYVADPTALPATFYTGDGEGVWRAAAAFDWKPLPAADGAGFVTEPLQADTFVAGSGSADLWINAGTATDTDLEVTISEVRPDGTEIYVQSGWLRASQRALDSARSTELRPVQLHTKEASAPLPANEFTPVRVEIYPVAHPFRAGSRLRLSIDPPGANRAVWAFQTISAGETVTIAHDAEHPSSLVLSVIPNVTLPPAPPACGSIRLQPCRPYQPAGNGG